VNPRLERVVPLRLGECLPVKSLRLPWAGIPSDIAELDENGRPFEAGPGLGARLFQKRFGARRVARDEVPLGGEEETPASVRHLAVLRESKRLLRQLCGRRRSPAGVCGMGSLLERRRDAGVALDCREREVARSFLSRRDDLGEPRVQRPARRWGLARDDRGAEQRMGEAELLAVEVQNRCVERLRQAAVEARADRSLHNGGNARNLERLGAETVDARLQELVQVGRDRELLPRSERPASAPALERASQLEREEGVAAGGFPKPDQGRARERHAEAGVEQLVDRADAQAVDRNRSQPFLGNGTANPRRHRTADRQQGGDRLTLESGEGVAKRLERGRIQPLDVVDRNAKGPLAESSRSAPRKAAAIERSSA
jgi:hypothetical protein